MPNKTILITGGAGFIASHLINYLVDKYYDEYYIINLDSLTYAGSLDRLKSVSSLANYEFVHGDICNRELVESLFSKFNINLVVHLAAESHVDNSINKPRIFIDTNIIGTFNLIESAKKHWFNANYVLKDDFKNSRFLHVSTDEVYGSLGEAGLFSETSPYAPNSPYSASKAASDLLVRSYVHTYGFPAIISNCSNNYGPYQHDEKLIPTVIRKALSGANIPVYGNGKNIRDWLYVLDHCDALDTILNRGLVGENYNIGTNNERTNIEIVQMICQILDELKPSVYNRPYAEQISYVQDRLGHDFRYAIDSTKIFEKLNWKPKFSFHQSIRNTIDWYIKYYA